MKKLLSVFLLGMISLLSMTGCKNNTKLNPNDPVVLTMWHVYGSQAESPMNHMINEFNQTIGKETGVIINVTSVSNSSDIHDALLAAASGQAGAGTLPDLFFCYPETAEAITCDFIEDWNDLLTEAELKEYVPSFLDEGTIDSKLLVLPIAKSSEALFVNTTIFDRFATETGASYDDLTTWDGLLATAESYFNWSEGKTFVMHDELLNFVQINTKSLGGTAYVEGTLNFKDPILKQQWEQIAKSAILGHLRIEDNYETVCMMTGDIVAGIGSTASILYFQDVVTYADNTTEPLVVRALPCPTPTNGEKLAMQQGVGLCMKKNDSQKQAASLLFGRWISQGETNLKFVTQSGYMPVQNEAFTSITNHIFEDDSYRSLYDSMYIMHDTYDFYLPPVVDGYYDILWSFYDHSLEVLNDCHEKYVNDENTLDALIQESFIRMQQSMEE